jgi:hypothetical protein
MHSENTPKEIKACMNCGSLDLTAFGAITDLKTPAENGRAFQQRYRCKICDYCGISISFDSEEDRSKYEELKKLRKEDLHSFSRSRWEIIRNTKSSWCISIAAGIIFFIVGAINLFKHDVAGLFFYGASLFFLAIGISELRHSE